MLWRTHFIGGVLAGTGAGLLLHSDPLLFAGVAGFASLFPDLDSPKSKLGSKVYPVSAALSLTVGHRGFMHSLFGAVLACAASFFALKALQLDPLLFCAVAVGYISHLFLDALNPQGVPLLWPCKKRLRVPLCQTSSWFERMAFYPLAAGAVWLLVKVVVS